MIISKLQQLFRQTILKRSSFSFANDEEYKYGIKFDEEQIKKKMRQIENRRAGNNQAKKKQTFQFMKNTVNVELFRKIKKFRQSTNTQNLLQFTDVTLQEKPTTLQITGYDEQQIQIDGSDYPPCMIVFPKQALIWEVNGVENLKMDDFIILKYISPAPTYVIVGLNEPSKFPKDIKQQLELKYKDFDVLQIFTAISQFNVTANDDINVVAFLISK